MDPDHIAPRKKLKPEGGSGRRLAGGSFSAAGAKFACPLQPESLPTPSFPTRCKFFSLTETPEDYTLMVDEEGFKGGN